jgi:hypothetical protein
MPLNHTYKTDWTPEYFMNWSQGIGPSVKDCIEKILQSKQYPEQNYKSCVGILTMASKIGKDRLNNACTRALAYDAVGYNQIKNILDRGLDKQLIIPEAPGSLTIEHENIRGSQYYA